MMTKALERVSSTDLTVANPLVVTIAARNGWKPETLVRRVSQALSSVVEQRLYLRIASSVRIQPESVAMMLRRMLGEQMLGPADMIDRQIGKNLISNRFAETVSQVSEILAVTHVLCDQYGSISIGVATDLVIAYGPDHVEAVADSLQAYISGVIDDYGQKRMAMALYWLATEGFAYCAKRGVPYPDDFEDWLNENRVAKASLHRYIGVTK